VPLVVQALAEMRRAELDALPYGVRGEIATPRPAEPTPVPQPLVIEAPPWQTRTDGDSAGAMTSSISRALVVTSHTSAARTCSPLDARSRSGSPPPSSARQRFACGGDTLTGFT
jgi:hypothetical protein